MVIAVSAVIGAGIIVVFGDRAPLGLGTVPRAFAQPGPTGPTGGSGGDGFGGPPFPMQPPGMPDGPGAYNGGSYPGPDQDNGISIYNSGAPQYPDDSQGGHNQAPNYPQQLPPANGSQPPDYDAPLQAPQPQRAPQEPAQNQPSGQRPQQNAPQQQEPTTVTVTVTASSAPPTSPAPPTPSTPPDNSNGSQKVDQQSDVHHEGDEDRSDQCPGNVSPLGTFDNVDPNQSASITVKNIKPFVLPANEINDFFGQHELTFQIAPGTPDNYANAFREAAKRWNEAQQTIDVHEIGPTKWYDAVGPSLIFNVLDSDPPKTAHGGTPLAQETPGGSRLEPAQITAWSQAFVQSDVDPEGGDRCDGPRNRACARPGPLVQRRDDVLQGGPVASDVANPP
ncbi:Matrixin family protein [Mycolicibacterium canariasense]|uniref:Matrixin family protein n=1 Tax=Mycolicibacterium canariasense TaxID=228230 RepID=A0A100WF56_MYCCR|nr:Matrixin family protein [Mycolicibacterium canariasense]